MRGRRYDNGSRGRYPSPRPPMPPRSGDFDNSRHRRYSPARGERDEYSRDAGRYRRIERRGHYDPEFELGDPRFSDYDSRDRDRHIVGARQSRSPPRIDKRDVFDMDASTRSEWLHYSRSSTSYRGDLSSEKFESGDLLGGARKFDRANMMDESHLHDPNGFGNTYPIRGGGERDDYWHSYADSRRPGLSSSSQYLDSLKPATAYEGGRRMHSHSYMMTRGGVDMPRHNFGYGDGDSHVSRYMNNGGADRLEYYRFHDDWEKRDGFYNDRQDLYFEKKSSDFCFQNALFGLERNDKRETQKFEKEDTLVSSQGYLKMDSDNMASSSSRPKDFTPVPSGRLREGFQGYTAVGGIHMPSHAIRPRGGLSPDPGAFDGDSEKRQNISPRGPWGQRSYLGLPEEIQGDHLYTEISRSKTQATIPSNVEEQFRRKHEPRIDVLNPSIGESSFGQYTSHDEEQWDPYAFPHLEVKPHKFDDYGPILSRKQDLDVLNAGNRFSYETEGFHQYGSVRSADHHADSGGSGVRSKGERLDVTQSGGYAPSYGDVYDGHVKRSSFGGLSLSKELSNRRLGKKQFSDEMLHGHDSGIKISIDGNGSRKIYNQANDEGRIDFANFSENAESSISNERRTWMESRDMMDIRPSSSKSSLRHPVKSAKSKSRDIKKRLGPVSHKLHVSHGLAKKYKSSMKKRLQGTHPKKNGTLPWLKNRNSNRKASFADDMDGTSYDQGGDNIRDQVSVAKPEPPEKSEDLKQMAQNAFFKFLKEINETSMKRQKYEQGKAGTLKCIVCGSNSEEFMDTESLAAHAFTSKKIGFRSQHLGLHRALCVVMGWKFLEHAGSEWHRVEMSNAEASALIEDFIVWPPVVIVHNRSIDNKNPDNRIIITPEKLHTKLKEMCFGHILKVCSGKPANQSVILVKFNGTLSGLHEALRYHQSFVKSKHGRAEMKKLNPKTGEWTEEDILYGYLGLAMDIDKLDFDTKKRCLVRSKKEILSIADAE